MASVLHGCARTTPRVRAELQASKASTRALATQHVLNPKTVAKWRKRDTVQDAPMGQVRRSAVLSEAEDRAVAEIRRCAMLPLDDLLGRLRECLPKLSRSWPVPAPTWSRPRTWPRNRRFWTAIPGSPTRAA